MLFHFFQPLPLYNLQHSDKPPLLSTLFISTCSFLHHFCFPCIFNQDKKKYHFLFLILCLFSFLPGSCLWPLHVLSVVKTLLNQKKKINPVQNQAVYSLHLYSVLSIVYCLLSIKLSTNSLISSLSLSLLRKPRLNLNCKSILSIRSNNPIGQLLHIIMSILHTQA